MWLKSSRYFFKSTTIVFFKLFSVVASMIMLLIIKTISGSETFIPFWQFLLVYVAIDFLSFHIFCLLPVPFAFYEDVKDTVNRLIRIKESHNIIPKINLDKTKLDNPIRFKTFLLLIFALHDAEKELDKKYVRETKHEDMVKIKEKIDTLVK